MKNHLLFELEVAEYASHDWHVEGLLNLYLVGLWCIYRAS
jgi:hypothetical protein